MAKKQQVPSTESGIILVWSYFALFIVNALVIYLSNNFFPKAVVLGTFSVSMMWAILHSAGVLALVNTLAIPFVHEYEKMKGRMFSSMDWMGFYFVLNAVALWIITRFSEQFGLGVSSWMVVAALAFILDMAQGIAMMQLQRFQK